MNNIIRFWNQNRRGIILGIAAVVLLIVVIQILNQVAKDNKNTNKVVLTEEEKALPTKSIIGGDTVSVKTTKENVDILEEFVEKCNSGQVTDAYNMLTDDCKEVLFPSEENFKTGYYAMIFSEKRMIDVQNYLSSNKRHTYLVKFYNDVMSSGTTQGAQAYQDYITVDENCENGKVSVNSFIYKDEVNKTVEKNGIILTVLAREVYKDNEKYQIKIENNTDKRILIDTRERSKSIYLVGSNNVVYGSNIAEIASVLYQIPAHISRTYKLRFNKAYSLGVGTSGIVFSDIVSDYEAYEQAPNETKDRVQISVSI